MLPSWAATVVGVGYVFSFIMLLASVFVDVSRVLARVRRPVGFSLFAAAGLVGVCLLLVGVPFEWRFAVAGLAAGVLVARLLGGSVWGCLGCSLAGFLSVLGVGAPFVGYDPHGGAILGVYVPVVLASSLFFLGFASGRLLCRGGSSSWFESSMGLIGCALAGVALGLLVYYIVGATPYHGVLPPRGLLYDALLGCVVLAGFAPTSIPLCLLFCVLAWFSPFIGLAPGYFSGLSGACILPLAAACTIVGFGWRFVLRVSVGCPIAGGLSLLGLVDPLFACIAPLAAFVSSGLRVRLLGYLAIGVLLLYAVFGWVRGVYAGCLYPIGIDGWSRPPLAGAGAAASHAFFFIYPGITNLDIARSTALAYANHTSPGSRVKVFEEVLGGFLYLRHLAKERGLLVNLSLSEIRSITLPGTADLPRLVMVSSWGFRVLMDTGVLMVCNPPADRLLLWNAGWQRVGLDAIVFDARWANTSEAWDAVYYVLVGLKALGRDSLRFLVYYALNGLYCQLLSSNVTLPGGQLPFRLCVAAIAYALNTTSRPCVHARLVVWRLPYGWATVYALWVLLAASPLALLPLPSRRRSG